MGGDRVASTTPFFIGIDAVESGHRDANYSTTLQSSNKSRSEAVQLGIFVEILNRESRDYGKEGKLCFSSSNNGNELT